MPWILMTHVRKFLPNHHCVVVTRYVRFGLGLGFRLRSWSELVILLRNGRQSQTQEMLYGVVSRCTENYCTSANLERGGGKALAIFMQTSDIPYLKAILTMTIIPKIRLMVKLPFCPRKFRNCAYGYGLNLIKEIYLPNVTCITFFACGVRQKLTIFTRTFEMLWKFIRYGPNWIDHIYHSTSDQNNDRLCF